MVGLGWGEEGADSRLRARVDGRTAQENLKRKGFTIDEQGRAHIKVKGVDDSSYIDKTQRYGLLSLHHISLLHMHRVYASYICSYICIVYYWLFISGCMGVD